jgi:hypothetical protein
MIRATLAQAAHFVLQKNYLSRPKAVGVRQLVADLAGLPADPLSTAVLAARVRLNDFTSDQLFAELGQRRTLIRSLLMRNSSYIVEADQFPVFYAATVRQRNQAFNAEFRLWGLETNDELEAVGQAILAELPDQPLSVEAVAGRLSPELVRELSQTSRGGRVTKTTTVDLALRWLAARGLLYAIHDSPDWLAERLSYIHFNRRYPEMDLAAAPAEAAAQQSLVRSYLAAFGPATEADVSFWTGLGKSETARAIAGLSKETTLTMVEGIPGMLLMLKAQAEALTATELSSEAVVNILPADDPFTTAYRASRSRYFTNPGWQRHVFNSAGAARPAILVNGQIVGAWDWPPEAGPAQLNWRLLGQVEPAVEAMIQTELEQIAVFINPQLVVVKTQA